MLRLCSVQQREVKTYRWKPYVNKVSAVVITLLVATFFPPLIDGPFPTLPSGLVRSSFIGEHISLLPSNEQSDLYTEIVFKDRSCFCKDCVSS